MPSALPHDEVVAACQLLFGAEVEVTRDFLAILQPSGAKAAFRRRAREEHPDLHPADPVIQQRQAALFHELTAAYAQISHYCAQRSVARQGGHARHAPTRRRSTPASPPKAAASHSFHDRYYDGPLPQRPMLLGRYLYYRRIIPYHTLLAAITWQRRMRPVIGQLAREWGWLAAVEVQSILASEGVSGRFGEKACQMQLLSEYQVKVLLQGQKMRQCRLGEYFVEHGYLTRLQLERVLVDLRRHNATVSRL